MNYFNKGKNLHGWRHVLLLLRRPDWLQIIPMTGLLIIGVIFIYGTGQQIGGEIAVNYWKKQILWMSIGLSIWVFLAFFYDYRNIIQWSVPFYIISIILLAIVLLGGMKINEARRWLFVGGISIQPSEFAKLAVLFLNSRVISLRKFDITNFKHIIGISLLTGIPFFLIVLEPDLGTAMVLLSMTVVLFFVAGLRWKLIILGIVLCIFIVPVSYHFLKDYQRERILVFLDPERDPKNMGWNSLQSELAVGSGGMYGKGFMRGTQNTLGFLPKTVSNTDFIYSVIAEEKGFVGAAGVVFLYTILMISLFRTAIFVKDMFGRCIATGIGSILFIHTFINIAMTIRLFPITGVPLPLVSYGGSFMICTMICLGITQSIYINRAC